LPKTRDELKSFYGKIPNGYAVAWALCPTDMWCAFLSLCAQNVGSNFISNRQIDIRVGSEVLDEIKLHLDFMHPDSLHWNPIDILDRMGAKDEIIYAPYLFGYTNYARQGYAKKLVHFVNSPVGAQKNISTIMGGVGLAVSALTRNPSLTVEFTRFVADAEIQSGIYTLHGGQPGNKLAWHNVANDKLCNNFFSNTILTIENAYIRPQHPGWNVFQEHGADIIHKGILQNTGAEIIMNKLNELYKSVLHR
jgi:multiple sugar transport system substrate-binding protein